MNCYIHIPFCASKCGYCAFYSEAGANEEKTERYLAHLIKEIEYFAESGTVCETLYVGGGTPTLLNCRQLEQLLTLLSEKVRFADGAERSIEANPETLSKDKIEILRGFFTRISVGVQSFNADHRLKIGRKCSQKALENALEMVRDANFPHWNVDLMYALPGQSAKEWENELRRAAETGVDHISCYSLTAEEGSLLGWSFTEDDERGAEFYQLAEDVLADYGIKRYEISNYAANGAECRHNCNVWRGGLLRGFGPAAAGFDGVDRSVETSSLDKWLSGCAPEKDIVEKSVRLNEIFAVNLRTVAGWSKAEWECVPHADKWEMRLKAAEKAASVFPGCLCISDEVIKLSGRGLLFWNEIAQEFF